MIFYLIIPILYNNFSNYFISIYIGSYEILFPRINNILYLLLYISYIYIFISIIIEYPGTIGWTLYPPLSTSLMNILFIIIDFIINSLLIIGISSFINSINFIGTINIMKLSGLLYFYISIFNWSINIISNLLIIILPILNSSIILLYLDLHNNTIYFDNRFGGDPILYQHYFWFFGHPEVYILIIPIFGLYNNIIINYIFNKLLFSIQSIIISILNISILGLIVWGHHIYTLGLDIDTRSYFTIITIIISLPTGNKLFNYLSIYLYIYFIILLYNIFIFILLFIIIFIIGGSTGILLGNSYMDISLHDTYYIISHFHFILSIGIIIIIYLSFIYYLYILFNNFYIFILYYIYFIIIKYYIILLYIIIYFIFIPMYYLGFNIQPRRISDYSDYYNLFNYISSINNTIFIYIFILLILILLEI